MITLKITEHLFILFLLVLLTLYNRGFQSGPSWFWAMIDVHGATSIKGATGDP